MSPACVNDGPLMWLRRVYLALRKTAESKADALGLSTAQMTVLAALCEADGLDQRAVQERLCVTAPTLTGIVDVLARNRFLERRAHPGDARVKQLFLTADGRETGGRIRCQMQQFQDLLLADFSPEETAQLKSLLQRLALKLEAIDV